MQAVILAAGKGIRLQPLTYNTPKPMLEVLGRPILEHLLDSLPGTVDEAIIVVGYLADHIKDHFGNEYKERRIRYAYQKEQLGTFDALHASKACLKGDPFLCLVGDDFYSKEDLEELTRYDLAMLVMEKADPGRFNICIEKDGSLYDIVGSSENDSGIRLIFTGACVLTNDIFSEEMRHNTQHEQSLPHVMVSLSRRHPIRMIRAGFWHSITSPDDVCEAERVLIKRGSRTGRTC